MSITDIGRIFKVRDNTIRKRAKKLGITVPKYPRGYWLQSDKKESNTKYNYKEIYETWQRLKSIKKTAKEFGCSKSTVETAIKAIKNK